MVSWQTGCFTPVPFRFVQSKDIRSGLSLCQSGKRIAGRSWGQMRSGCWGWAPDSYRTLNTLRTDPLRVGEVADIHKDSQHVHACDGWLGSGPKATARFLTTF